jgi:SulP family sulfate permease
LHLVLHEGKTMLSFLKTASTQFLRPVQIIRTYRRENLAPDIVAGLTVGVVLLPQAIAFPLLAGLPPTAGLYAAMVVPIIAALWGSSHHLHTGPTNTASILTLSVIIGVAAPGTPEYAAAAGLVAVMAGVIRLAMGLLRLGMLVNFVSDSVAIGFSAGAGVLIIVNQLDVLLGVARPEDPGLIGTLIGVVPQLPATHIPSLIAGVATIALIVTLQKIRPRAPVVLLGIGIAGLASWALGFEQLGGSVLGTLPTGLPPPTHFPMLSLDLIGQLANGALAIAVIGLVESSSISRSLAGYSGQRLDSNQEFVGQGLANIVTGFFSGYPASGSFNRSALAYRAGAQTAIYAVVSGVFVLVAALLLGPLTAHLPRAVLAGALILTAYGMIDRRGIARIWRSARGDATIMIVTLAATLLLPLQFAVLAGVLMSLGYYILQTSAPRVDTVLPDDAFRFWVHQPGKPGCPQLAVVDILGDLYFGAVNHVEEAIRAQLDRHPDQRFLLLRMQSVQHCDISGIHMLESVVRYCRGRGGDVFFSQVRGPVMQLMETAGFTASVRPMHFHDIDAAVTHLFYHTLDPAICIYECEIRAFRECQNLPKRTFALPRPSVGTPPPPTPPEVAARDLWQQLRTADPPFVVDVREPREYRQGHIPQAQLVPLATLLAEEPELPRDRRIVLACRSGRRSARAAAALHERGYHNLVLLQGGMLAWEKENLLEAVE